MQFTHDDRGSKDNLGPSFWTAGRQLLLTGRLWKGSPRPFPPTINDRVAVTERAIRNEFPDAPRQIARGFHQAFLNHFALCSSEMRVDSNSKSRYQPLCLRGVIVQIFKFHPTSVSLLVVSSFATIVALLAASFALPLSARAATSSSEPNFGQSVYVFNPSMSLSTIQATVDAVASEQVSNQFGTQRYALLFEPGTYGSSATPLIFQVGYYTTVAGLGLSPSDVTINGEINVSNQCFGPGNCTALVNFWRSLSNLTINVASTSNCTASAEFWAVSQAAPIRRVQINGNLFLFDYCSGPGFASGGFIADSQFSGTIINATQQQWITRNSNIDGWTNGVWNQVFSGVVGAPVQCFPQVSPCSATISLVVNSKNVILDDIWAWRADHGSGVSWTDNTADTGLIVNGDNVTAYGLFVEHYQKYEVIWNGNAGTDIFFQNEMPYDPPNQAAWMEAPGVDGWAAFKVANSVTTFSGYGMGSYSFFNKGVNIYAANAFEVPDTLAASSLHDLFTIFLSTAGSGGILNVVNGTGGSSTIANPDVPVTVVSYP